GAGGMGSVWVAQDHKLDRKVAIKFIAGASGRRESMLPRFRREARIAAKVDHPHVVQVFDYGVHDALPYLVMELLTGESLDERLDRDGRLSPRLAIQLVDQLGHALAACHERGILHRDVKPANVFLVASSYPIFCKLVDFGIAKPAAEANATQLTASGVLVGTPAYMSPEQLFDRAEATAQTDVWALSVLAYQVVTGELPFEGETVAALGRSIDARRFTPPSAIFDDLPEALDALFTRAFAPDPEDRFADAVAFVDAFVAALSARGDAPAPSLATAAFANEPTVRRKAEVADARTDPASPAARELHRLGRYRLLAEIGQGGMADVFVALREDEELGVRKLLVVKRLRAHLAADDDFVRMILDEARLAARLNHPQVVQTLEAGKSGGSYFIAMEYLEGQPLHRVIARFREQGEPLPEALGYAVLRDMLAGLHYAHELCDYDGQPLEVVHRDVSPHNVFVTYDGRVKVMDFGIAKAARRSTHTETGVVKGKIAYMAPEQARGRPLDRRADIFAAGVMLWEIATGKRFWGDLEDPGITARLVAGDYPRCPASGSPVSARIDAVCQRALATEPSERYATAAEMASELEEALAELSAATGQTVDLRDLGRALSARFADDRRALERQIDAAMKALGPVDEAGLASLDGNVSPQGDTQLAPAAGALAAEAVEPASTNEQAPQSAGGSRTRPGRTNLWVLGAGLVLGAAYLGLRPTGGAFSPAPVATSAAPAPPSSVVIQITAHPPEARIAIDGVTMPDNPHRSRVPSDAEPHHLVVSLDGYQPVDRELRFDRDSSLELVLRPLATGPVPSAAGSEEPPPVEPVPRPRPSSPAAPSPRLPGGLPPVDVRPIDTSDPWGRGAPP
ncbi:MAG: serine/threonine protein kinase, partial [Myxococcales bacterium]|nr:serine/threonine protein kinase [Myxococcales bacterium]